MGKVIPIENKRADRDFVARANKVADAVDHYDNVDLGEIAETVAEPTAIPTAPLPQVTGEKDCAPVSPEVKGRAPNP